MVLYMSQSRGGVALTSYSEDLWRSTVKMRETGRASGVGDDGWSTSDGGQL